MTLLNLECLEFTSNLKGTWHFSHRAKTDALTGKEVEQRWALASCLSQLAGGLIQQNNQNGH